MKRILVPILVVGLIVASLSAFFIWEEITKKDKIAVIEIKGELFVGEDSGGRFFGTTPGELQRALEKAARREDVKAVVLRVDSPGGSATASYEMFSMLRRFEKPTVAL